MKRYDNALILKGFHMATIMREYKYGDYVKYEDVEKIIRKLLNEHTHFSHMILDKDIKKYIERN